MRWPRLALGLRQLPPLRNGSLTEVDVEAVRRIAELVKQATGDPELAFGLKLLERSVSARKVPVPVLDSLCIFYWTRKLRFTTIFCCNFFLNQYLSNCLSLSFN